MLNSIYSIYYVLAIKFECGIMKVGNSIVMVLPKSLCDNYGIKIVSDKEKNKLQVLATDSGMFIPLKQKEELKEKINELLKEMKK